MLYIHNQLPSPRGDPYICAIHTRPLSSAAPDTFGEPPREHARFHHRRVFTSARIILCIRARLSTDSLSSAVEDNLEVPAFSFPVGEQCLWLVAWLASGALHPQMASGPLLSAVPADRADER